jgi:hypothetical protein
MTGCNGPVRLSDLDRIMDSEVTRTESEMREKQNVPLSPVAHRRATEQFMRARRAKLQRKTA